MHTTIVRLYHLPLLLLTFVTGGWTFQFLPTTITTTTTAFTLPRLSFVVVGQQRRRRRRRLSSFSALVDGDDGDRSSPNHPATMSTTNATNAIGLIGIGIMGTGMASRLLSTSIAGTPTRPLVIYNRTPSKCTHLQTTFPDSTIIIKETAREVVESTSVCFSMLSTPEAAQIVFQGDDGVLAGVSGGKAIVDCATLAEVDMKNMSEAVTKAGGRFLEAPVSGSKAPAANGSLIFLCAGDKSLFEEVVGDGSLNAMGKSNHFLSEQVGYGTRAKLVVNSLMGTMVAAYSESLTLTEKVGLDPSTMIQIISEGAITSPVYGLKGPKMVVGDHSPNFPLKHAHKDMDLAVKMAGEAGVEFKVNGRAEEVFRSAREDEDLGVSDEDFSAVVEKIRKGSEGMEQRKK